MPMLSPMVNDPATSRTEPLPWASSMLVVEDNANTRAMMRRAFDQRGKSVWVAETVAEAGVVAEREQLDIAIVERLLPDGDGDVLVRKLRALHPRITIVMFTGAIDPVRDAQAVRDGALLVHPKPSPIGDLCDAIERGRAGLRADPRAGFPTLAQAAWDHMMRALELAFGSNAEAGKLLGIGRTGLQRRLRKPPPGRAEWKPTRIEAFSTRRQRQRIGDRLAPQR